MKRIFLLTTMALMLAAAMALSGVAQAKPITEDKADKKCLAEAVRTVEQPGFNPSDYTFHGGSELIDLPDDFTPTDGPDVFCGFGDIDFIVNIEAGDIFLGGTGDDTVLVNEGIFYGGEGNDFVSRNEGTFNGGPGIDTVGFGPGPVDGP